MFLTRKPRFRVKISVFSDKNHLLHCKSAFLKNCSLENIVFEVKFSYHLIKTEFSRIKYYYRCKLPFSTRKPRFRVKISVFPDKNLLLHCKTAFLKFFSLENIVFDVKFTFLLIKTEFSTIKYYFRCKLLFSTRTPHFRVKISVFPDKNHLLHCKKTAFLKILV